MSFRPGARLFTSFRPLFRQPLHRRRVGTSAAAGEQTGFAKFWNSSVGPKTVHFWYVGEPLRAFVCCAWSVGCTDDGHRFSAGRARL